MLTIDIEIKGDKELIAKMKKLGDAMNDWTAELKEVGEVLKDIYSTSVFVTEGSVIGESWQPLSEQYEFWKRKNYPGKRILQRTGVMQKSYTYTADMLEMRLWNETDYAIFHQRGTSRGLPARVMVKLDQTRKDAIVGIIKKGVVKKIRQVLQ